MDHLKSRPIVSCPGSLLHGLGIWVDRKLQDVAKTTISYFKNSLELKEQLTQLNLPPNARLFSADAVSMYTNIPTHTALNLIGKHITQYQRSTNGAYPVDAIRDALRLVMTMNIFTFGDLTLKQLNGTAMGTPPAPPYATINYGIHEKNSSRNIHIVLSTTGDLLTMLLASGLLIQTHKQMTLNGTRFKIR